MKTSNILIVFLTLIAATFTACKEDREYPAGLPEFENYYYAGFLPWNNTTTVSVPRAQTTLVKFPVQFHSVYTRAYDPEAKYTLISTGQANPAVVGQDFNFVDKTGNVIQPTNGQYSLKFSQAKAAVDTIYIKLLNSTVPGTRKIEINIVKNETSQYTVGNFSQAFKRFLEVK
ncbi:hypothetical protein [Pedobacter insulae]|uniref:DUF4843 domain-containing protein n=1 Tax=Pedobacter insulae TaxID=414048 RepID=A0A1I2V1R9_9SPHI|nr:hypothetical protein [Pedobacter insulae]SFG83162.1 hypothetical protein SAMN04489864_102458 [Pedobacter insulae]